jgi:hypothetical protein
MLSVCSSSGGVTRTVEEAVDDDGTSCEGKGNVELVEGIGVDGDACSEHD